MKAAHNPEAEKRLAVARAKCALLGITVECVEGDFEPFEYCATKWALTHRFTSLPALETWVARLMAPAAEWLHRDRTIASTAHCHLDGLNKTDSEIGRDTVEGASR